jgi:hypothetical protein
VIDPLRAAKAIELFKNNVRDGMKPENATKWAVKESDPKSKLNGLDSFFEKEANRLTDALVDNDFVLKPVAAEHLPPPEPSQYDPDTEYPGVFFTVAETIKTNDYSYLAISPLGIYGTGPMPPLFRTHNLAKEWAGKQKYHSSLRVVHLLVTDVEKPVA